MSVLSGLKSQLKAVQESKGLSQSHVKKETERLTRKIDRIVRAAKKKRLYEFMGWSK